jgi:glycerol kinase
MLPEVKQSSEIYGETCTTLFSTKIPIAGVGRSTGSTLDNYALNPEWLKTPTEPAVLC